MIVVWSIISFVVSFSDENLNNKVQFDIVIRSNLVYRYTTDLEY